MLLAKNKELEVTKVWYFVQKVKALHQYAVVFSLYFLLQEEKEKARAQKEEVVTQVTEVLENELQCIICSELFIEVTFWVKYFINDKNRAWKVTYLGVVVGLLSRRSSWTVPMASVVTASNCGARRKTSVPSADGPSSRRPAVWPWTTASTGWWKTWASRWKPGGRTSLMKGKVRGAWLAVFSH